VSESAILSLGADETIGSLAGAGLVSLGVNTLTTGGTNATTSFSGATSGTGNLIKQGSGTMYTGNLAHTGVTSINSGEMNVNGLVAGSVIVKSGAMLSGDTSISGDLILNSGGALSPGNSPGTTTVAGTFSGGGVLNVEVQLGDAGAPVNGTTHDFLNITGNATGVSTINIVAVYPSFPPTLTMGNGIELVRVGGTAGAEAFVLGAPVIQEGIKYELRYLQDYSGALDGFFLQSTTSDGIMKQAAVLASGRMLLSRCYRGEEHRAAQWSGTGGKRTWVRYAEGSFESAADTGLQMDQNFACGGGGMDVASSTDLRLGLVGGYGSTEVNVATLSDMSRLRGELAVIEALAAYAKDGFFVNLSAGYSTTDWTQIGVVPEANATTVDGLVSSVVVGRQWAVGTSWQLSVSGEINYDGTTCSEACIRSSTGAGESTWQKSWRAGLSARIAGTMPTFRPFISASWSDDVDGGNAVSLGTASANAETGSDILGARVGFDANLKGNIGLFADVGVIGAVADPDRSVSGFDGQAGVRFLW
jgi:hypothetical protein